MVPLFFQFLSPAINPTIKKFNLRDKNKENPANIRHKQRCEIKISPEHL